MAVDVLVIGAHPDDTEIIVGGTIAKLVARGKRVAAVDLTRGEMGTRGTPETRFQEAQKAAEVLGMVDRICLDMGDGYLENSHQNKIKLMEVIRQFRPLLVMTHHWEDLHPDHCRAGEIMKDIMYPMGMVNFPAENTPYRPNEVLFFMGHFHFEPSFIVDVGDCLAKKTEAVKCYQSQLYNPEVNGHATASAQPDFLLRIEARARHYGSLINKTFGEPFFVRRPVPIDDPVELYKPFPKI